MIRYRCSPFCKLCEFNRVREYYVSRSVVEKSKLLRSRGSIVARQKLKGIDGRAPPVVELAAQLDPTPENLLASDKRMIVSLKGLLDCLGGGAWPFVVGDVNCLVDSVNERDRIH